MEQIDTEQIKPGFFKLRAKAHTQTEAGIPENLRAVETKKDTRGRSGKLPTVSERFNDPALREALIIKYIKDNPGVWMPYPVLAQAADYGNAGGPHKIVNKLLKERRIRRRDLGNRHYTYEYVGTATALPKGDPRNGEVVVTKPGTTHTLPKVIESAIDLGEAIAKEQAKPQETVQAKTPVKPSEEVFCENLDRFIWEFIKQHEVNNAQYQNINLGQVVQALREFSKWMSAKASQENANEQQTDEPRS